MFSTTPLHLAAARDDLKSVELLIAFDAGLESVDSDGDSPLMRAVSDGCLDAVRLLLELNADTTKSDWIGWTVSQAKNEEIKQLLLEHLQKSVRDFCFDFLL